MRRVAASILALSLLLLAGCSDGDPDDTASSPTDASTAAPTATAEDIAALEAVTLSGEAGAEPTLDFEQPFTVSAPVARIAEPGTGDTVEEGQLVTVDLIGVSGADGSSQGTTYGAAPQQYIAQYPSLPSELLDAMIGSQVGARILYANPTGTGDSFLWAFEVRATESIPNRAEGEAVAPAEGLPTVTLAEDGQPSIEPVDTDPPTELVTQTLIKGDGAAIEAGQNIVIQYSGWLWDGTLFDSSWENGAPLATPLDSLIEGWKQGMVGQTVGSQVLLIVPPALGYGDNDQGSIPGGSTLIFVIDVLAAS